MDKRKRINLTLNQKLEVIKQLESGVSVSRICEQYGIRKQTVSDIKKNKDKINKFMLMCDVNENKNPRKRMKFARETSLEEALLKWYIQQRSCGAPVRTVELKSAAIKLSDHMNINSFKASDGWLWRFRKRHGILNDAEIDLERVEVSDFCKIIQNNVGQKVAEEDGFEWLESDEDDPGYHMMTESEIGDELLIKESENESEEEESILPKIKLSTVRSHLDDVISFIDNSADSEMQLYCTHFRNFRELIIKKQKTSKIDTFFKPVPPKPGSSKTNIDDSQRAYIDISSEDE